MFKDLKEYQEITQLYHDSVNISEEQRAINNIFIEEGFTSEEIEWLEENFDELWENELAQFTQECIAECYEGQDLTEEQIQQLDEVLGLKLLAKGITKAAPIAAKGLRKANIGIKKGLKAVGKKVSGGAKAIGTGIKDTARGAASVGKSALKKVGGAIKKAAPIIGTGALLGTGAALPVAAGYGVYKGIKALRNRGKAEREKKGGGPAGPKATDPDKSAPPAGPKIGDAAEKGAQQLKKLKDARTAAEKGAQQIKKKKALPDIDAIAKMDRSKVKKSGRTAMIKKNIDRFGQDRVQHLQNKQVDFKKMRRKEMSKDDFIKKYPNSITAQRAKGLRDHAEWDSYDMVLEYLFSTEQVTTLEEANYVMMEMDQQTVGEIVTEVKQELHELLPLAGLALGGLAVNALRKRGKAKREAKAAGKAALAPAGTAAGKAASKLPDGRRAMISKVKKKQPGDAVAAGAKNISSGSGAGRAAAGAAGKLGSAAGKAAFGAAGKLGSVAGKLASAAGAGFAAGAAGGRTGRPKPKPMNPRSGRPTSRPPHGRRAGGGSIGGGSAKKSGIDLSGKTKAQIMALKRLGKI